VRFGTGLGAGGATDPAAVGFFAGGGSWPPGRFPVGTRALGWGGCARTGAADCVLTRVAARISSAGFAFVANLSR
jgi:hypothetical protein